jgi:amino acid transporter
MADKTEDLARFGTFGGVFTPTLLTILGVIMYLRLGWVVGNAGLLGGLVIILLAFGITGATGLAMSSLTTNIRIGAGGAYAIIAQSLGLEVGGALGIPRYISQALAVTMYIFGFRAGWLFVFPEHPAWAVDFGMFAAIFGIAFVSARFAIQVQYVIMAVIAGSLVSVGWAAFDGSMQYSLDSVDLWGSFSGVPEDMSLSTAFWHVFAVFLPATTGIMAGANMSGELKNPKKSIPLGTMAAIGVSLVIYLVLGYWIARSATTQEMVTNYQVMIEKAAWWPAVVAGLLGACFSSALASLVGASRILQAMGDHRVVPKGEWLSQITEGGEPRNALWITGGLVFLSMLLRDLNAVAPLITMFFLITYAMLNVVVLIEQSIGLVSFRPLLKIPRWVSGVGLIGSAFAMFIISPTVSLVSVGVVLAFYVYLTGRTRELQPSFQDVRSGLFFTVAEWAAKQTTELPEEQERAWKPNLLMPVRDPSTVRGDFSMVRSLTEPQGSVKLLGIADEYESQRLDRDLGDLTRSFRHRGVFATSSVVNSVGFEEGVTAGMQTLQGQFFRPNILFLHLPDPMVDEEAHRGIIDQAVVGSVGVLIYVRHPKAGLGEQAAINVWVHDRSPDWELSWDLGNLDLSLLVAYKLKENWDATMRIITVIDDPDERQEAEDFLEQVCLVARMPEAERLVVADSFHSYLPMAPHADLNVFGLLEDPQFEFMRSVSDQTESSCLFVQDSGNESVFA